MLLHASCLARLGNSLRASTSERPVVIMAIYIHRTFRASRYLVYQPVVTSTEVQFVTTNFDLTAPRAAFEFIFQLYNFVSAAKVDNDDFHNPEAQLALAKESVAKKGYKTLGSMRKHEATDNENSSNPSRPLSSPGAAQDSFGNPSVQEDLVTAGYTLNQRISEELTPLTPLKPTMRQATSRSGISVVLKTTGDSNERRLLQDLSGIKAPSNHTIPLLEVIDLSIGKTLIVLPWKSPLDEVLRFRDRPDDVESFCTQFIEGVAFLHHHNVAHRDLKPGNVVVDTKHESKTSPRLFIIDFDLAQFVENEETMVESWCGTPPWIAPDLGSRDGPTQRYSPILADRWACGRMIKYFAKYIPAHVNKQHLLAFAQQLLSVNPRARPPLNQLRAINGPTKRRSARSLDGPVLKRHAVNRHK
ncbi:kinase-like domain-containing protein [Lactifluus subvellereus]|nr:kinase-like domain-containing protein [Lactifluus subvellereus]